MVYSTEAKQGLTDLSFTGHINYIQGSVEETSDVMMGMKQE